MGARRGARPPLWRERAAAAADRRSAVRPRSRRMQRATCNVDAHSTAERAAATADGTHSATERSYTVGPVPYRLCPGSVAAAAARAPYCGLSKALRSCARVVPAQMWEGRAQSRRRCGTDVLHCAHDADPFQVIVESTVRRCEAPARPKSALCATQAAGDRRTGQSPQRLCGLRLLRCCVR